MADISFYHGLCSDFLQFGYSSYTIIGEKYSAFVNQAYGLDRPASIANSIFMDKELKANQATLRQDLIAEVERYLGYAEDAHSDYISVNEKTFEVGFRSRHDQQRKPDLEYYSVLDFMMSDGLWFKVDNEAIEAVVQEHLPSPNIDAKFKEWCEVIKTFLVAEQTTSLHSCKFSIGSDSGSLSCFDEQKEPIEDGGALTFEEEMEEEWETVDIIPMRKAVSKTSTGYTISRYNLTKIILNYFTPSLD